MADPAFREAQWRDRFAEHVRPLNEYVDELVDSDHARPPYIAPVLGGVNATVLTILRDPGPMTQSGRGSGFICAENDDQTAETLCRLIEGSGMSLADTTPWNAYPWYINKAPSTTQLRHGAHTVRRVIELLPNLKVVLLLGTHALRAWNRYVVPAVPSVARRMMAGEVTVLSTYHPSRQALWHPDPSVRAERAQHRRNAFLRAAVAVETKRGVV